MWCCCAEVALDYNAALLLGTMQCLVTQGQMKAKDQDEQAPEVMSAEMLSATAPAEVIAEDAA